MIVNGKIRFFKEKAVNIVFGGFLNKLWLLFSVLLFLCYNKFRIGCSY